MWLWRIAKPRPTGRMPTSGSTACGELHQLWWPFSMLSTLLMHSFHTMFVDTMIVSHGSACIHLCCFLWRCPWYGHCTSRSTLIIPHHTEWAMSIGFQSYTFSVGSFTSTCWSVLLQPGKSMPMFLHHSFSPRMTFRTSPLGSGSCGILPKLNQTRAMQHSCLSELCVVVCLHKNWSVGTVAAWVGYVSSQDLRSDIM